VTAAILTRELSKHYGNLHAVDRMDLEIPAGSAFGLIGPNGAGKSTTMAILASLLAPTSGSVEVAGFDPTSEPREVRRRLGYMPDVMGVYDNLRVDEYLQFFAASYGIDRSAWSRLVDGLLELVDLNVKRDAMVDSLSRGMKQRLSLARALVHDPEVLILDEPASGLDPRARVELRGLLAELRAMGKTVVISSHILAELEEMCTHVAVMEAGRLLASGTPNEIFDRLSTGRVVNVHFLGGEVLPYTVQTEAEQAELVRRLVVEDGLDIVQVVEGERGLESLFLQLTEGTVQ